MKLTSLLIFIIFSLSFQSCGNKSKKKTQESSSVTSREGTLDNDTKVIVEREAIATIDCGTEDIIRIRLINEAEAEVLIGKNVYPADITDLSLEDKEFELSQDSSNLELEAVGVQGHLALLINETKESETIRNRYRVQLCEWDIK